jgi:hypothetical protein
LAYQPIRGKQWVRRTDQQYYGIWLESELPVLKQIDGKVGFEY